MTRKLFRTNRTLNPNYLEKSDDIEWCKGLISDIDANKQDFIKTQVSMGKNEVKQEEKANKAIDEKWGGEQVSGAAPGGCIFLIIILFAILVAWLYFKFNM